METAHWKRVRRETVTLLRCAADLALEVAHPIAMAHSWLGFRKQSFDYALGARKRLFGPVPNWTEDYRAQLLEAAQHIEEGGR